MFGPPLVFDLPRLEAEPEAFTFRYYQVLPGPFDVFHTGIALLGCGPSTEASYWYD